MNTSILTVVLAGALMAGQNGSPTMQSDYGKAQQQAVAQKKPLAILFGAGTNGWTKVAKETAPSADLTKLLSDKYVCLYIDTASPDGKKLAGQFGLTGSVGIVLTDRGVTSQAFWHQGDMANANLVGYLQKYADPQVVLRGTETVSTARTSFYPSIDSNGNVTTPFDSYCPSCNSVRSRR